jgi:hypothetical protein
VSCVQIRLMKRPEGLTDIIVKRTLREERPTQVKYGVEEKDVEKVAAELIAKVAPADEIP